MLLETLDHADAQVRRDAFAALTQIVGAQDQPEVLKAVKDKRPYVRAGAIGCSFRYKDQPRVWAPILLEALRDDSAVVRRQAAMSLQHFRSEEGVVPALIEALKDKDVVPPPTMSVAPAAASSLNSLDPHGRPAVPGLMELSKAGHELNRPVATQALGHLAAKDEEIQ